MTNYTYSKISAANFNTSPATVARSATGSVYAVGDTTYTTPLNMTLVVGGSVVTSISSDTNGYFPDFTLLDRTSCVWKQNSVAFATVLTTTDPVPGPPGASGSTGSTGPQGAPGDVSIWKTTTFYPLNTPVTNPSGDLVKVTTAHTSTGSYDATKFAPTGADATKLTGVVPDTNLRADLTAAALSATYGQRKKGLAPVGGAFQRLMATLDEGKVSVGLTINGDSTGKTTGKTRWTEIVAPWLAEQYPNYATQIVHWDGSTTYLAPSVLSGTPSARSATMIGAQGGMQHPGYGQALTGDLDIRVKLSVPAWPLTDAAKTQIVSRWGNAAGLNSWYLFGQTDGTVRFKWSADGLNQAVVSPTSSVLTIAPNTPTWIRVTLTLATGAVAFYTSTDGTTWTAKGAPAGSGATTLFDTPNQPYMLGSSGTSPGSYVGTIDNATFYGVEVRDGIGGMSVVPYYPDNYVPGIYLAANGVTYSGKPVLTIMNGSWPGASMVHMDDATNRPRLNPLWHNPQAMIFNIAHNDGAKTGKTYLTLWDAWLANLKTRYGNTVNFSLVTQNPKIAGLAGYVDAHAMRRRDLLGWAQRNNVTPIDVYKAFLESSTALTSLVDSDGIHPSDASGSPLWADVVKDYLTGKITA